MKKYRKIKRKRFKLKAFKSKKLLKVRFKTKLKIYFFILLVIIIYVFCLFIYQFEKNVVPIAISITQKYTTNMISQEIDKSVEKTIKEMELYSNDFFHKNLDENNFIDVNTILINNVCSNISGNLTKSLNEMNYTEIVLPIGIITGLNAFSDLGPKFKSKVTSVGNSIVDYETSFESVGINQINFQIYVKVSTKVAIINPLYKKDVEVSRKIMLVNTVFNGEVPNTYLNIPREVNRIN